MRSPLNRDVPLAGPGEFQALELGPLRVYPPVVLAPMAGITNAPFRTLCRRFSGDRCLYVSEMITAKSFAMGHAKTLRLASFDDSESTRSIQLYGTHPDNLADATKILANEWGVDHIDMNFGCPVRKVTSNGGGAAIPARPGLMARLVRSVVSNAGAIPVTIKFRKGINDDLPTYRDAGRIGREEGCKAVALHARTAAQLYSGEADWDAIADLKSLITEIPVLGNGDVFESFDALRMMRTTGCDGVVVGRGCLGRPWLFGEFVEVFDGREPGPPPKLGQAIEIALEHARLLIDYIDETAGIREFRKFLGWYTKSFPGAKRHLPELQRVESYAQLQDLLANLPADMPFPEAALRARRAKTTRTQTVSLPPGFLDHRDEAGRLFEDPTEADPSTGGG